MSSSGRGVGHWIRIWWPVVLGVVVITFESTEWMGADHTGHILRPLWQAIFGQVSDAAWDGIHHYIRKSGHFFGYGLLGLAWLRAWWMTFPRASFLADAALAMSGTFAVAAADEFHQSFLPNRTSSPWDVLLDCSGAFVLLILVYVFVRARRPEQLARAT